jgi:hypothetical protein
VSPLKLEDSSVPAQKHVPAQSKQGQEPPDVAWLVPELDDGADDPLLRPEPEELELEEPEEPVLVEPELLVPDDEPVEPEDPDDVEDCEDDVPLVCEAGSIRVTTPAVATLARLTATVVLLIRLRPRARAAIARRTCSRFGVFMTGSLPSSSGELLCTSSQPPMSLDADVLPLGPVGPFPSYNAECGHEIAFEGDIVVGMYTRAEGTTDWPPVRAAPTITLAGITNEGFTATMTGLTLPHG